MPITLDLRPDVEARLLRQARRLGVPVSEYVEKLMADVEGTPSRKQEDVEAYLNRVRSVLKKFDELPRLSPPLDADQIIGYDQWGLPER
jgi:hypothetical protein